MCCICVLNLKFSLGSNCEKMKREMRELFYSFVAVRHKNIQYSWPNTTCSGCTIIALDFYFCVDELL